MAEASAATSRTAHVALSIPLRRFGVALFLLWLVSAVLVNSGGVRFSDYQAAHFVLGSLLVAYAVSLVIRRKLPGPTPLDLPIAALLTVNALAIAFSPYRALSLESSLEIAAIVVVFHAFIDFEIVSVEALARSLVAVGALLAVLGVIAYVLQYLDSLSLKQAVLPSLTMRDWLPRWYRPAVFYHTNILAAAMNLVLPFALALILRPKGTVERILAALTLLFCFIALLLTDSRGAWLGCAIAFPTFILCCFGDVTRLDMAGIRRHKTALAAAMSAILVLSALTLIAAWSIHPSWLFRPTAGSRFDMARAALNLASGRPLLGFGPNVSFGFLYPSYTLNHPHNQYLEILVGSGLVGVIAAGAFAWVAAHLLLGALGQRSLRDRAFAAASIAALTSILIHGLVDVPLHWPGFVLLTALVVAIAVRLSNFHPKANTVVSVASRAAIVALIPLCLFAWLQSDRAQSHFASSIALQTQGDLRGSVLEAEQAAAGSGGSIAYQLNAGVLESITHQSEPDTDNQQDQAILQNSVDHLRAATSLDPRSPSAFANLAQALRLSGDKPGAADAARNALEFAPENSFLDTLGDPSIASLSGTVLQWAGRTSEAIDAYAEAIRVDPSVAESPYWSRSAEEATLRQIAIAQSSVSACTIGRSAALYGSSSEDLSNLASQCQEDLNGPNDEAALAIILEASGKHDEALQAAEIRSC